MSEHTVRSRKAGEKIAALLLAVLVVALVAVTRDVDLVLRAGLAVAFPLVVVCFAEEVANGARNLLGISFAKVPVRWIRFAGWFALLGVSASWILFAIPWI